VDVLEFRKRIFMRRAEVSETVKGSAVTGSEEEKG
jgi:hypothetical protein